MSLLTELTAFFGNDGYKYVAPTELIVFWYGRAINMTLLTELIALFNHLLPLTGLPHFSP
jgi:hypothetical protein